MVAACVGPPVPAAPLLVLAQSPLSREQRASLGAQLRWSSRFRRQTAARRPQYGAGRQLPLLRRSVPAPDPRRLMERSRSSQAFQMRKLPQPEHGSDEKFLPESELGSEEITVD